MPVPVPVPGPVPVPVPVPVHEYCVDNKEDKRISGSDKTNHGCTPLKAFPFLSPDCMCIGERCICDAHNF